MVQLARAAPIISLVCCSTQRSGLMSHTFPTGVPDKRCRTLFAGRIDYQCATGAVAIPPIMSNLVKAIAILTKNRSPVLPDVASAHEQGLTDFDFQNWYAIFLPKGTPAPIIQRLHAATVATLEMPFIQARLKEIGAETISPERRSSEYLAEFVADEIKRWTGPIKASGIQM
jgi:tripartite-type tricarboxylate transporter receptor subunit TctC